MMEGFVPWPEEFIQEYKAKGYWEDITGSLSKQTTPRGYKNGPYLY